jgi:tetratricopeptide (TPR) repeat protein
MEIGGGPAVQGCTRNFKPALWLTLLLCSAGAAAETGYPELDLGIARFALATDNHADALSFTRESESEHESMIRARALVNTGDHDQAAVLLDRLIEGDYYRGEAALLRSTLMSPDDPDRTQLIELASRIGHGETRQKALYELAEMARTEGRRDKAGQILATMDSGYWAALGYMNIAADYGKRDLNPSRALISLRVAMAMADEDPDRQRGEALKARLLVRAGLLSYESEDYDKAISFLERVDLESYSTPQALYLHGLALSAKGNHRDAMQSWHRAKKYPLAFAGVTESWLGTGRGYDLAGYLGQAGEAYLSASASYESERVTLRQLAESVREKGAYQALVAGAGEARAEWFLADSRVLSQPRSAYLLRFLENAGAQQAVDRVKDLQGMLDQMAQQQQTLDVFREVLKERLASSIGQTSVSGDFESRFDALVRKLAAARDEATAGSDEAQEIRELAKTLSDLRSTANRFPARAASRNQRLGQLADRVNRAIEALGSNRQRAEKALIDANADLDERVLAYVEGERQRMVIALEKAEQQIAHLYEYLALKGIERGAQ